MFRQLKVQKIVLHSILSQVSLKKFPHIKFLFRAFCHAVLPTKTQGSADQKIMLKKILS